MAPNLARHHWKRVIDATRVIGRVCITCGLREQYGRPVRYILDGPWFLVGEQPPPFDPSNILRCPKSPFFALSEEDVAHLRKDYVPRALALMTRTTLAEREKITAAAGALGLAVSVFVRQAALNLATTILQSDLHQNPVSGTSPDQEVPLEDLDPR